jgi:hypothetical protein
MLFAKPKLCAKMHCDKHVVKMILEYAQILCTAHRIVDDIDDNNKNVHYYKKAHVNHPSVKWARETKGNYMWLYYLFKHLCKEYTYRYEKTHLCDTKLRKILKIPPKYINQSMIITKLPQCMPNECKIAGNPIVAYRKYYIIEKAYFAKWKKRDIPDWFKFHENINKNLC